MNFDSDELIKNGNVRTFAQYGGAGTKKYFYGDGTQYNFIESPEIPTNGSIDPIYMPSPRRANRYELVGRQIGAPSLPKAKITFSEKWDGIPRMLMAPKCPMNFYEVHSRCGDFSDFNRGWEGYINIYSQFMPTDTIDLGNRNNQTADEMLMDGVNFTGVALYPVGQLSFGEEATTQVVMEVIDAVYGTQIQCSNCGVPNDGSQFIYAVTRANVGSPSAPGQLVYTLDGGDTWNTSLITGIGTTNSPTLIDIAGNVLFVAAGSSLFYTVLNSTTGAPSTWSSLTTPAAFTDVYVRSANEIYFVGTGSTNIYRTTDITIAASSIDYGSSANLHRITGYDSTIIATGNSGTVRYSTNAGVTWTNAVAPAASLTHAVAARRGYWIVGNNAGNVYVSRDNGNSWTLVQFPNYGTGSVTDIVMVTNEVIWIAQNVSNVAYLATTMDGGDTWASNSTGSMRIVNFPTFQSISRMAAPIDADAAVAANYLTLGGLATGGGDGFLISASPTLV
jgi:hypothetical protein